MAESQVGIINDFSKIAFEGAKFMIMHKKMGKNPVGLVRLWTVSGLLAIGSAFMTTNAHAASCGTSGGLDTSNVIFRGNNSDGCGGVFSGNDSLADVNLAANNLLFGGTNWTASVKDDNPGSPTNGSVDFLGLNWTLSASAGASGSWTLTITDPAPATALPVAADFLAVLKGGNAWAAYWFNDESFNSLGSSNGTFQIVFTNNGGNNPDLSHLTLYMREGICQPTDPSCTGQNVPEPSATWLLGLGLLGFAGFYRKQSSKDFQA